jgi:uncharacterized C2H2 Zn-finger protein
LHKVLVQWWGNASQEELDIPKDWLRAIMVALYKNKGARDDFNNWRGVWLLSHASKVASIVLNGRLQQIAEQFVGLKQAGYLKGRGCPDDTFTLRRILEDIRATRPIDEEEEGGLYLLFVDLRKAFDSVPRDVLWYLLKEKCGVPEGIVRLIQRFHEGMQVHVTYGGQLAEPFETESGVRQGCVKAPTLWDIYFGFVMEDWRRKWVASRGAKSGVPLRINRCGPPLRGRDASMHAPGEIRNLTDLEYADDTLMMDTSWEGFVEGAQLLGDTIAAWGGEVAWTKTEWMWVCGFRESEQVDRARADGDDQGTANMAPCLKCGCLYKKGLPLQIHQRHCTGTPGKVWADRMDQTEEGTPAGKKLKVKLRDGGEQEVPYASLFKYLGSLVGLSGSLGVKEDIDKRVSLGFMAYRKLLPVWRSLLIPRRIKGTLLNVFVASTLLWGAESWPMTRTAMQKLRRCWSSCVRRTLGIQAEQNFDLRIPYLRMLDMMGVDDIVLMWERRTANWLGHVARMERERWPRRVIQGYVDGRAAPRTRDRVRGMRRRWNGTAKQVLERMGIADVDWVELAQDREGWAQLVEELKPRADWDEWKEGEWLLKSTVRAEEAGRMGQEADDDVERERHRKAELAISEMVAKAKRRGAPKKKKAVLHLTGEEERKRMQAKERMEKGKEQMREQAEAKLLRCHLCPKTYKTQSWFTRHINEVHGGQAPETERKKIILTCEVCGERFTDPGGLGLHVQKMHLNEVKCEKCGGRVAKKRMTSHMLYECTKAKFSVTECGVCGKEVKDIGKHKCTGVAKIECPECHQRYTRNHFRHHDCRPGLKCKYCGREDWKTRVQFGCHEHQCAYNPVIIEKVKDRPFACPDCPARYNSAKSLATHRRLNRCMTKAALASSSS